jgi:protein-tyrosine phosphatase
LGKNNLMPSVLFVCTGNQCRSPLAAAFFRERLGRDERLGKWVVSSAGTWTRDGLPVLAVCSDLARANGVDLSEHRTRSIANISIRDFDVIVVMEQGHQEALASEFPETRERVFLLTTLAGLPPYDIQDPLLQDAETASDIIRDLRECIELAFAPICQVALARKNSQY